MKLKKSLLAIGLILSTTALVAQSKIEQTKRELKSDGGSTTTSSTTYRSYSAPGKTGSSTRDSFDGEESLEEWIVSGVVLAAAFVTYHSTIGNYNNENHLHNRLTPYPYIDRRFGNYTQLDSASAKNNFRIEVDNHLLVIDRDLLGNHFKTRIRPFHYAFFQFDYYQLSEYNPKRGHHDHLSLFNFNVGYDRIRFNRFNLGWTLGVNYVGNEVKKAGFTYGFQVEAFLPKNISLLGAMRFSSINSESVNELDLKVRYHIKRWYLSAGYEQLKIASPMYNFAAVGVGIYL